MCSRIVVANVNVLADTSTHQHINASTRQYSNISKHINTCGVRFECNGCLIWANFHSRGGGSARCSMADPSGFKGCTYIVGVPAIEEKLTKGNDSEFSLTPKMPDGPVRVTYPTGTRATRPREGLLGLVTAGTGPGGRAVQPMRVAPLLSPCTRDPGVASDSSTDDTTSRTLPHVRTQQHITHPTRRCSAIGHFSFVGDVKLRSVENGTCEI